MIKYHHIATAFACVVAALSATSVAAQGYPNKPIRFVVPFAPGGGNDLLAREIGQELQKRIGQPVIVENRAGAGGTIGGDFVAKAPADGYTILMAANSIAINAVLAKNSPYDLLKDFSGIARVATIPIALVVTPDVPAKNVQELVAHLKANPGKLNYASAGPGTVQHLAAELFQASTKTRMEHIPFKGATQMVPDMLAGRVQVLFGAINTLLQPMKLNQLRGLATTGTSRSGVVPDLPTVAEAVPGYAVDLWYGVLAPSATPPEIVAKLNQEITAIMKEPNMKQRLSVHGLEVDTSTPQAFTQQIRSDVARWTAVVKENNIKGE
jgi:tripartite-type tricarboxylate transporter receptor subunit TctC